MATDTIVGIKVPAAGESVTEAIIGTWTKADGDYVFIDEVIVELESDKATMELPAEVAGKLKILVEEGETVEVGSTIAEIDTSAEAPKETSKPKAKTEETIKPEPQKNEQETASSKKVVDTSGASPAARKLMEENSLDSAELNGSGKDGRITKEDVLKRLQNPAPIRTEVLSTIKADFSREANSKKMSPLRKTIARRLVNAKNETAMLTTFNEVNMEPVKNIRSKHKQAFIEKHNGTKLGFMSFFLRACAIALQEFPVINAKVDEEHIVYHDYADISIAVSTPKGLVVPVIRNAESLSIAELEQAVSYLATKGRNGKLTLDEMEGGTFTITNGGVFGSLVSTPIINQPQSAILGMHAIQERPIALDGQVVIKPMMYLAMSYDHRIIDGKDSVRFLVRVKELLENPDLLLTGNDPVQSLLGL